MAPSGRTGRGLTTCLLAHHEREQASLLVAEAAPHRDDLYFPGRLVRDSEGRVVGAESLARLPAETIVVSTAHIQGDGGKSYARITVAPAVAGALRGLAERLWLWVETPAERGALAARWRQRLADLPDGAPGRQELERLLARDQALSGA